MFYAIFLFFILDKFSYNFIPETGSGECKVRKKDSVTLSLRVEDSQEKSFLFKGRKCSEEDSKYVLFFYPKEKKFVLERPTLQISDLEYQTDSAKEPPSKTGLFLFSFFIFFFLSLFFSFFIKQGECCLLKRVKKKQQQLKNVEL